MAPPPTPGLGHTPRRTARAPAVSATSPVRTAVSVVVRAVGRAFVVVLVLALVATALTASTVPRGLRDAARVYALHVRTHGTPAAAVRARTPTPQGQWPTAEDQGGDAGSSDAYAPDEATSFTSGDILLVADGCRDTPPWLPQWLRDAQLGLRLRALVVLIDARGHPVAYDGETRALVSVDAVVESNACVWARHVRRGVVANTDAMWAWVTAAQQRQQPRDASGARREFMDLTVVWRAAVRSTPWGHRDGGAAVDGALHDDRGSASRRLGDSVSTAVALLQAGALLPDASAHPSIRKHHRMNLARVEELYPRDVRAQCLRSDALGRADLGPLASAALVRDLSSTSTTSDAAVLFWGAEVLLPSPTRACPAEVL